MKTVITMISSIIVGALITNTKFSPMHELQHWLANKRRFFYAVGFYAAGFVFLMAGIISGTIDATLQYEAQGFVFWSAMSSLAMGFAVVGLFSLIAGRLTLPRFLPEVTGPNLNELLEIALKFFGDINSGSPEAPHPVPRAQPVPPMQPIFESEMHH